MLPEEFYCRADTLRIARDLLGKVLCTNLNNFYTTGVITETEAYLAPEDQASHAFNYRKTERTKQMYMEGGCSYVYLCYGIHSLFNIVTNKSGVPHAILVRAIEPLDGKEEMLLRCGKKVVSPELTSGPGRLSKSLGIGLQQNGVSLVGKDIWIEDRHIGVPSSKILATPRIGIDYAGAYVEKPWRFIIKDSVWVSKAK